MKRVVSLLLAILLSTSCASASAKPPTAGKGAKAAPAKAAVRAADAAVPQVLQLARPKGGEWFGLYVLGRKAGYAFFNLREGTYEGQRAIVEESQVTLRASVAGVETVREVSDQRFYEYRDGGRLLAFREERRGDGGDEILIGRCTPQGIELLRKRPGVPDELRTLPPTGELVEHADAPRLVARTRQTIEGVSVDLEQTLEDKTMTTSFESEGTRVLAGVTVPVVRTRTTEERSNLAVITTIAEDGRVLELGFGEVMVGKAEEEKLAKRLDKVDLFNLTRVVLDQPISEAVRAGPAEVSFEIAGLGKDFRNESYRQRFSDAGEGRVRLTITSKVPTASARRPVAPGEDEALKEALEATLSVESEAPAIVALAKKVVGDENDAWAAAKRLNLFVHDFLTKAYGSSSDRATAVLATRKGDCTEHALLYTALARAAGIPARRVDGLVYMDAGDAVPALYWHEWAEVWVGEWVAVDPTFNQTVADPTHIAFGTEGQSDTAGLIGQLKIKVLEVKAGPAEASPGSRGPAGR